jgi:SecD/SecF fusion protein
LEVIAMALWLTILMIGLFQDGDNPRESVTLIYKIETQAKAVDQGLLRDMIRAVERRLRQNKTLSATVDSEGNRVRVRVPAPSKDGADRLKRLIAADGFLEFRIVANTVDHRSLIERAESNTDKDDSAKEISKSGVTIGKWVRVPKEFRDVEQLDKVGKLRKNARGEAEALVAIDEHNVTHADLKSVKVGTDELGRYAVAFSMNNEGATKFEKLSGENLPDRTTGFHRQLGIILDNVLLTAPRVVGKISGEGLISANFTKEEAEHIVNVLNAGRLPAKLTLESERQGER